MKSIRWSKEVWKLILLIAGTVLLFIIGYFVVEDSEYSSTVLGVVGGGIALSFFQLSRIINFNKNPKSYDKEQIDVKDERNIMLLTNAKSSAYGVEKFVIFGISLYAIYLKDLWFVLAILILWISRIASFIYYFSKSSKQF